VLGDTRREAIRERVQAILDENDDGVFPDTISALVLAWDETILRCREIQMNYDYIWAFLSKDCERCLPPGKTKYEWCMYVSKQPDESFMWELLTLKPMNGPKFHDIEPTEEQAKRKAQAIYEIYARDEFLETEPTQDLEPQNG